MDDSLKCANVHVPMTNDLIVFLPKSSQGATLGDSGKLADDKQVTFVQPLCKALYSAQFSVIG